ncbi:hypothetical protein NQ318_013887 [Aromia moschata]|uniref:BED-type domain-containing protein n=1 Tax=Aromia moschata TaxID=1265417 RepID=A0AAV8ZAS9_9CUCU|nr:hypothetical protein NQ318_013887 [Aromia moschata]
MWFYSDPEGFRDIRIQGYDLFCSVCDRIINSSDKTKVTRHLKSHASSSADDSRYSPTAEDYGGYGGQNSRQYQDNSLDAEPLFYNSRPRNKPDYTRRRKYANAESEESQDAWASCESSFYNQSVDSVDAGYSVDADYYRHVSRTSRSLRRPSLERQTTLYDDVSYYGDTNFYHNTSVTKVNYVTR